MPPPGQEPERHGSVGAVQRLVVAPSPEKTRIASASAARLLRPSSVRGRSACVNSVSTSSASRSATLDGGDALAVTRRVRVDDQERALHATSMPARAGGDPTRQAGRRRVPRMPSSSSAEEAVGELVRVAARAAATCRPSWPPRARAARRSRRRGRCAARRARRPRGRARGSAPRSGGARRRTARGARPRGSATRARRRSRRRAGRRRRARCARSARRIRSTAGRSSGTASSAAWKASAPSHATSQSRSSFDSMWW